MSRNKIRRFEIDNVYQEHCGAVAKRLGRHFIGCDIRSDMVQIAKRRLSL